MFNFDNSKEDIEKARKNLEEQGLDNTEYYDAEELHRLLNWHTFQKWNYLKDKKTLLQELIEIQENKENETNRTN